MAPGLLLGSTSLGLGLVFSYFLLRVLLRKSLSPPLLILGHHETHHTALSNVLPTRSLFADWFAQVNSGYIYAVNKSWFYLSKITTPNTFHFLTSACLPAIRRVEKLWAGLTPEHQNLCLEKLGAPPAASSTTLNPTPPILRVSHMGLHVSLLLNWAALLKQLLIS